jgi:ZIP family zinc transporter
MLIICFSAIAGILGTGFGGLFSAILLKRPSDEIVCWMLSFAAGVMTGIVFFSLAPESIELFGLTTAVLGLMLGIFVIMVLNRVVDKITDKNFGDLSIHLTPNELHHSGPIIENHAKILRSGIIMFAAISLHNLPEGLAIGAGGSHDLQLGIIMALMIMLHNVPEGMAIAAPMIAGGINRWKVVAITALSGVPTLIGGIAGIAIGGISDAAVALSLSMAGGAMLYVVFGEIIPQVIMLTKNRMATVITISGIIIGLVLAMS